MLSYTRYSPQPTSPYPRLVQGFLDADGALGPDSRCQLARLQGLPREELSPAVCPQPTLFLIVLSRFPPDVVHDQKFCSSPDMT